MESITDTLRRLTAETEVTRYAISQVTGIDQAALLRFVAGGDMRGQSLDKLADYFDLELRPCRKKTKRP